MENKNFKELFKDLLEAVEACGNLNNNCFKCDRAYDYNSKCFISNEIYKDLCDGFYLVEKGDPDGDEQVARVFQEIKKIFDEKDKEISRLVSQMDAPKTYPWET